MLSYAERRWLKRLVDEEARRRLLEARPDWHRCRCGARLSDFRSGCSGCQNRHKQRRRARRARWQSLTPPRGERAGGVARWNGVSAEP